MYGPRTLERLVDPALADLQVEYDAAVQAGRKWRSVFGYYVIMYSARRLGLDGEVPAVTAAWAPNAALLILSFAVVKLGSFPTDSPARA
jgi:hypothetical protein